jgi:hypothetical protein
VSTEVGEELVGAYLAEILGCDHVVYNVSSPRGGPRGVNELDVAGLDFAHRGAYLCEVNTHLHGYRFKNIASGLARIRKRHRWQKRYAKAYIRSFPNREYMSWSPRVAEGAMTKGLKKIN